jgi:hypothetical protein
MIFAHVFHGDNWTSAINYVNHRWLNAHIPYIRVGVDYYKITTTVDRYGISRKELKVWNRATLIDDNDKKIINSIAKFDNFTNCPSNTDYQQVVKDSYNIYREFVHKPAPGEWPWIKILLEHIFGEQYDFGIQYMQMLYQHPDRYAPILVLASIKRATGKTTFLNWINQLFGDNCAMITADEITNSFNASYAHANIIAIEETINDRKEVVEKLKSLSAGKFITMNRKFVDGSKIAFFGHFIITSNDPKRFLKIDENEIRFWVRTIEKPKFHNTNIEEDLRAEIPAFIHYLNTLPPLDWSRSRMMFESADLNTKALEEAVFESRSWLYKDLCILFEGYFSENHYEDKFRFRAEDIKEKYFSHNSRADISYIDKILKEDFKLKKKTDYIKKYGKSVSCYTIHRKDYVEDEIANEVEDVEQFDGRMPF